MNTRSSSSSTNSSQDWPTSSDRGKQEKRVFKALRGAVPSSWDELDSRVHNVEDDLYDTKAELTQAVTNLSGELQAIDEKRQHIKESVDRISSQVKSDRLLSIQILAIFVAFFTFVSVEFQLFSAMTDPISVLALTMLLFGALLIFVCLMLRGIESQLYSDSESKDKKQSDFKQLLAKNTMLITAAVLFLGGAGSYAWLKKDYEQEANETRRLCRTIEQKMLGGSLSEEQAARLNSLYASSCAHPQENTKE